MKQLLFRRKEFVCFLQNFYEETVRVLDYNLDSISFENRRANPTAILNSKYGFPMEFVNMKNRQDKVFIKLIRLNII